MGHRSSNRFKEGTCMGNRSNRLTEASILRSKEASPTATRSECHRNSRLSNRTTLLLIIPKEGNISLRKGQKEVDQAAAEMKSGSINLLLVETAIPNRHPLSLLHLLPRTRNRHQRRPIW